MAWRPWPQKGEQSRRYAVGRHLSLCRLRSQMREYGAMVSAREYALEKAPPDVRAALDWLTTAGFRVRGERGGRTESFGSILVEWEHPPLAVRVVRDRSQWIVDIALDGTDFVGLQVVLNAIDGGTFVVADRELGVPLPETLPEGVAWSAAVPQALTWLQSQDRSGEIASARETWADRHEGLLGQAETR